MNTRTRLLLVVPHLGGGGAERVTAQLARHLNPQLFEIHLALISSDGPGAELPPAWVTVHRLNLKRVRNAWLPLLRLCRAIRPQVILSNMAHLNFLVLLLKPLLPRHTRVLVRQNTTASAVTANWITHQLYRVLYPHADAVLCQSPSMADDLFRHFGISQTLLYVLQNPIDIESIQACAEQPSLWRSDASPRILTVGRLAKEKGYDILLHATAILRHSHPSLQLAILGLGPEEPRLHSLAFDLDLNSSVIFAGHTDPTLYYSEATLYVQPSLHEGMPNALLEAAAAGLPLVTTPCSQGLVNLLQRSPGTWIAPAISAKALAASILQALAEIQTEPARYSHDFLAPFELKRAIAGYEAAILCHTREPKSAPKPEPQPGRKR